MNTVIIGGGRGCESLLKLTTGSFLKELTLDVLCVVDIDPEAPGMQFAREVGICTTSDMVKAFSEFSVEAIIELTGKDAVLEEIYKIIPQGAKLIDHQFAHIFWDLVNAQKDQELRLLEKIELEQKIEKERKFLQNIFDGIPDLVVVIDKNRKVIRINKRFAEFTGITTEAAIGMNCRDIFKIHLLSFSCQSDDCLFGEVFRTNAPLTIVRRTPQPDEIHWEITMTPILGGSGETEAILCTWYRITEKVMLKREIEEAELKFKRFIESAHAMISIKDLDGCYVIVNRATADIFGMNPEDFIGKRAEDILTEKIASSINHHDKEVIRKKLHQTYEEIIEINGREHYFNTIRFPLTDYKGSVIGTCTIDQDITNEKELQNQLVQATKLAAVGKLAAGVAHEINNPLTGILAYAEDMVDEMEKDSPFQEDLKVIIRETMRCRNIVGNLLDFARMDVPKFEQIDPSELVSQSLSLIEKLPNFKDIKINKILSNETPLIQGDMQQLTQVILNFMLNAADAMHGKGTIILTTECIVKNDKFAISVEDSGPGIPENLIDKIFEPFFSTKGTNGLGLAVSWGIIERHHGTVEIDMADNGGAIFRVMLPVTANGSPLTNNQIESA